MGISTLTHAGYRELKKEFDTYKPTAYFQDQFRPVPESAKPTFNEAFAAEKTRIENIKSRWEKSLTTIDDKIAFLRPDPKLLSSLRPAETDAAAAADVLKNTFSLKSPETLALLRNPGINGAENSLRGAIEAFTQVAELDEILRRYTAFTEVLTTGVGPMKGKDPVVMKFPFPGVLYSGISAAKHLLY